MANLTFAVADLHGSADLLQAALEAVEQYTFARPAGSRTLVCLGDYIDRGPQSREVIEQLVAGPPLGWRWVCLKGNHEDMMLQTVDGEVDPDWWLGNGGGQTLLSYKPDANSVGLDAIPASHVTWARSLPLIAVDRHRVFVHAGVDPAKPLDQQSTDDMLWARDE